MIKDETHIKDTQFRRLLGSSMRKNTKKLMNFEKMSVITQLELNAHKKR